MNDVLHFRMERHDDEGIYYVISGVEIVAVTDGDTIEEALHNLREAVELYYEGDGLPQLPRLEVLTAAGYSRAADKKPSALKALSDVAPQ